MAIAILEAQMYAAEQRRSEQLAAVARASRTVTSALELDELLALNETCAEAITASFSSYTVAEKSWTEPKVREAVAGVILMLAGVGGFTSFPQPLNPIMKTHTSAVAVKYRRK